jgi:putative transcriptional regulator
MLEKLKDLRIKNKYTYKAMADLLGISKTYYWQIENNKRGLSYIMAYKISMIFNMKPDDIFLDDLKVILKQNKE